jgi:hypothetical protein
MNFTDDEIEKFDTELEKTFIDLQKCSNPMKNIKQIQSLILSKGARLDYPHSEYLDFNFADAVNRLLIDKINDDRPTSQRFINFLVQMFKSLIISNLNLLYNRSYATNGGCFR